jgi:hypothetical protein
VRPARPGQAEQLRGLVERLPHRVVERGAEPAVPPHPLHRDALAMPAREQQQQVGEGPPARVDQGQARGQRMRFQVVDGQ